jgi:hypothetical protein
MLPSSQKLIDISTVELRNRLEVVDSTNTRDRSCAGVGEVVVEEIVDGSSGARGWVATLLVTGTKLDGLTMLTVSLGIAETSWTILVVLRL